MPNEDGVLQPHELAEKGLGPAVFGPPPPTGDTLEAHIMDIDYNRARSGPGTYVCEEEIIETLPDGRQIQIAAKGTELPMTEAVRLGLVKSQPAPVPAETKVEAPAETKAAATEEEKPAAKKSAGAKK